MRNNREYLNEIYKKYENMTDQTKDTFYKKDIIQKQNITLLKRIAIMILCLAITSGVVYAGYTIYTKMNNAKLSAIYGSEIPTTESNQVWVGTFQLAWNELMRRVGGDIIFTDGETPSLVTELNKQRFTEESLSTEDYYITVSKLSAQTRNEIKQELQDRLQMESDLLNEIDWSNPNNDKFIIYAALIKQFTFPIMFQELGEDTFNDSNDQVNYFGVGLLGGRKYKDNAEVLYYNNWNDCAIKLKTNENEDVILYRVDTQESFDNIYRELLEKTEKYKGNKKFGEKDSLKIPEIKLDGFIHYDQLCNRPIEVKPGIYWSIEQALQNINFTLNRKGGGLKSEAGTIGGPMGTVDIKRSFEFNKPFVLFLKESDKQQPYFALKIDNIDILVKPEKINIKKHGDSYDNIIE